MWCVLWSETLPSLCRYFAPTGKGSVFCVSGSVYCNSVARGRQVISVSNTAQRLRGCKQKKQSAPSLADKKRGWEGENIHRWRMDAGSKDVHKIRTSG